MKEEILNRIFWNRNENNQKFEEWCSKAIDMALKDELEFLEGILKQLDGKVETANEDVVYDNVKDRIKKINKEN